MIFSQYELIGKSKKELDTEIRFICASARVEGAELIYLYTKAYEENKSTASSVKVVLGAMKRAGLIQFYVSADRLAGRTVEADFLNNKYGQYISSAAEIGSGIFVKIQ